MAHDQLFKRLCNPELIEVGWHLAHADSRDDFARTDPFGYADYDFKAERFRFTLEQLRHDRYRVGRLTEIDIPKTGLSVRPGNILPIEEATILHAIIYLIAPKIDPKLRDGGLFCTVWLKSGRSEQQRPKACSRTPMSMTSHS